MKQDQTGIVPASMVNREAQVRTIIVEDESLFRDLLRIALSQHSLEVVGAFADGPSAVEAGPRLNPQVAILDIELGGRLNGIEVGLLLRQKLPQMGVVLLSNHGDPECLASLPQNIISGWSYLLKKSVTDVDTLARAIEGAAAQLVVLDPHLVVGRRPRVEGSVAGLTPRQREILGLIAQGFTNSAIASRLLVAEKTVENQINQVYQQLGLDRSQSALHPRVQAVLLYLRETWATHP